MSSDSSFRFRLATTTDKDAVLGIRRGAFGGLDYLPAYYDFFMSDPNRQCIVCELDGKAVGFLAIYTVDDGRSYLAQSGRVSNEVEGRGVFRQLVDHCRGRARAAGCVRELMTTNHMNKHIYTESCKAEKTTIIKKAMITYMFDVPTRDRLGSHIMSASGGAELKVIVQDDFYPLLTDPVWSKYCFPDGWIMLDWVLFKAAVENIKHFKGRNTEFVSDMRVDEGKVAGLLSAHTHYDGIQGQIHIVDVFGSDVTALEKHVLHHLKLATDTDGSFGVSFSVEVSFAAEVIRLLKTFGIPPFKWHKEIGEDGIAVALGFETII